MICRTTAKLAHKNLSDFALPAGDAMHGVSTFYRKS